MTHDREAPFQQRSSTRQFLLYHADLSGPKVITGKIATLPEDALTERFPDLKIGPTFVESTLTILEKNLNFNFAEKMSQSPFRGMAAILDQ